MERILNNIIKVLEEPLIQKGFKLKTKNIFERINNKGQQEQYSISLSKRRGGYFHLHLVLMVLDKEYLKKYNEILKKTLTDERYKFPSNWREKDIRDSIKTRTKRKQISSLTDWKCLRNDNESLNDYFDRFSIWYGSFDEIEELKNWQQQLITSTTLIDKYFDNVDTDYIINNSINNSSGHLLPLFLLKDNKKKLNLYYQECRNKILERHSKTCELDIFYEYLISLIDTE